MEALWGALCIVFLIYAASAFVSLQRGELGPDAANVIGVFGGIIAGIAAGIISVVTMARKRRARGVSDAARRDADADSSNSTVTTDGRPQA
jgi:hypothetical protein